MAQTELSNGLTVLISSMSLSFYLIQFNQYAVFLNEAKILSMKNYRMELDFIPQKRVNLIITNINNNLNIIFFHVTNKRLKKCIALLDYQKMKKKLMH